MRMVSLECWRRGLSNHVRIIIPDFFRCWGAPSLVNFQAPQPNFGVTFPTRCCDAIGQFHLLQYSSNQDEDDIFGMLATRAFQPYENFCELLCQIFFRCWGAPSLLDSKHHSRNCVICSGYSHTALCPPSQI